MRVPDNPPADNARPITFSVYPSEHAAMIRIMHEQRLKSAFDVVRVMAATSQHALQGDFKEPKRRK
jgi:hypothetical protein